MKLLSRVFKASNINLDESNKYFVQVGKPVYTKSEDKVEFSDEINEDHENNLNYKDSDDVLHKAKLESEKTIKKAQVEAMRLLYDVKVQCEMLRTETEGTAYKKGYDEGYAKGISDTETIKKQAEQTLQDARNKFNGIVNEVEEQMVDLIISITTKLLNNSVTLNPKTIMALIRLGLSEQSVSGDITVRVSSEDYDIVNENKAELDSVSEGEIKIVKDNELGKSDCIIETAFGSIDCSLGQQFDELKQNIYFIAKTGNQ